MPNSPSGQPGRGVPDVAGDADPVTGYNVLVDGNGAVIGGTSAVAPLWAGLTALFNQSIGKPVGFLNPLCTPQAAWPPSTTSRWEAMAGITVHQDGIPAPASEAPMERSSCRSLAAISRHQRRHKLRLLCDRTTHGGSGCEAVRKPLVHTKKSIGEASTLTLRSVIKL